MNERRHRVTNSIQIDYLLEVRIWQKSRIFSQVEQTIIKNIWFFEENDVVHSYLESISLCIRYIEIDCDTKEKKIRWRESNKGFNFIVKRNFESINFSFFFFLGHLVYISLSFKIGCHPASFVDGPTSAWSNRWHLSSRRLSSPYVSSLFRCLPLPSPL